LQIGAIAIGLFVGLGLSIPLARGDAKPGTIPVSEIKEGMKGYGLTVFHGTEPERFDVEVIGVLHNFRPGQELILVKTPHPRLNITKNVRGMSGSPIYLDGGRLAGAYAYSWALFPTEPVAGVTPIAPMLAEMRRAIPPGFWPLEGAAPLPSAGGAPPPRPMHAAGPTTYDGTPGEYDLEAHSKQIAQRMGNFGDPSRALIPSATPLLMAGVGDRAAAYVRKLVEPLGLEPLQAGGGQAPITPGTPSHFVNGGAIGVQFVTGDISMMGMGTVTHVEGAKLCGFGHPMFEAGNTAMPTSIGRVLWIYASDNHSTKIGEVARPLGALVNDRQSAIVADENAKAPMFPMSVRVVGAPGAPKDFWRADVAEERFMTPSLAASVLGSVVEATVSERRDVTWKMMSKLSVRGHGTIELEDFGVAIGGLPDPGDWGHARIVRAVGDVINNPWEQTRIERIESVLSVQYTRDLWRLRGVDTLDEVVDAGQSARLVLHLVPFAGPEIRKTVDVKLPAELAGKDVEIEVLPGYETNPDTPAPENLNELLANETAESAIPRSVVLQFKVPLQGVAYRGHVAPRLPPFALDSLRPLHSDTGPEPFTSYARTVIPLEKYIEGHDKVKVRVRTTFR
jgi:hypothetical protein